jgi:hypothetical protein
LGSCETAAELMIVLESTLTLMVIHRDPLVFKTARALARRIGGMR